MNLKKKDQWPWLWLSPALALIAFGLLAPGAQTVTMALEKISDLPRLAGDARFISSLRFTLAFAALSVPLELAAGLMMGLALAKPLPFSWLWRTCLLLPWALPSVVSSKLFGWLYHYQLGLVNLLLEQLAAGYRVNWMAQPWSAWTSLLSLELWKTVPLVALLLMAGRQQVPMSCYEAAALDGAGAWKAFRHVTLPLLRPFLVVAGLFRLVDALRIFDSIWALTGGGPAQSTESLSFYAHALYFRDFDLPYGAWISLSAAALALAAALLITRSGRFEADLKEAS